MQRKSLIVLLAAFFAVPALAQQVTNYIELPTIVVIYPHYSNSKENVHLDLSAADIETLKQEVDIAKTFLWRSSHLKCLMKTDYLIVDRVLTPGQIPNFGGPNGYWLAFWSKDGVHSVVQDLYDAGIYDGQYSVVLVLYAFANSPNAWAAYGGGTYGPDVGCMGDAAYVANPLAWGLEARWVTIHEYLHAVDALFYCTRTWDPYYDQIMHSADQAHTFGHVVDTGEHFNYELSNLVPPQDWFLIAPKWAVTKSAPDLDHDGVPDSGDLPITEAKLGSSPTNPDTDGDGLADRDELSTGFYESANLLNADTDGDGIRDGADRYPLYAVSTYVRPAAATLDGAVVPGEYTPIARLGDDTDLDATLYLGWSADTLHFAASVVDAERIIRLEEWSGDFVELMVDARRDGFFFQGQENYRLQFHAYGRPEAPVTYGFNYYADPSNGVEHQVSTVAVQRRYGIGTDRYWVESAIPASLMPGLNIAAGQKVRISVNVSDCDNNGTTLFNVFSKQDRDRFGFAGLFLGLPGDLDCDGAVTFKDINPFVQCLTSPADYQAANPGCDWRNGDVDADGQVTFKDINPFVALLSQ